MPVSRRTGKRYAAGSQATLGNFPRVCARCGGRVLINSKKDTRSLWFETTVADGVLRSFHFVCRLGWKESSQ